MADENSFQEGDHSKSDGDSENTSANESHGQEPDTIPPLDGNKIRDFGFFHLVRNLLVAGAFATGLWILADKLNDLGYLKLSNEVLFLACMCFVFVLPYEAAKIWSNAVVVWSLFIIFVVVPIVYIFFCLNPQATPQSHLELDLNTSHTPDSILSLTNECLMMKDPNVLIVSGQGPYLCIPTPLNEKVALRFSIRNASPNTVNLAEAFIGIENGAPLQLDADKWHRYINPVVLSASKTALTEYFWQSSKTLLPGDIDDLPPIWFSEDRTNGFVENPFIVSFKIRAQKVDSFGLRFSMVLPTEELVGHSKPCPPLLLMVNTAGLPTNDFPLKLNIHY